MQSDSAMDLSAQGAGGADADFMGADLALAKPGKPGGAVRPSSHRLVVQPHFPYEAGTHGCKLCPANLCKVALGTFVQSCRNNLSISMYALDHSADRLCCPGSLRVLLHIASSVRVAPAAALTGVLPAQGQELENLRRQYPYQRIVYCGDGANDLCPALSLTPSDAVLARRGHALQALIKQRAASGDEDGRVVAQVHVWDDHSHLFSLVQRLVD